MASPADPDPDKPGKIRTWWHPLLAGFLRWQLGGHYDVREEVPVGKKPLQIDFLLLHKTQGELSDHARTLLAGLAEYLNEYTLVELKSPSDTLWAGDFRTLLAYALLYCSQQQETLEPARMTLIVIAPRLTRPYEQEMRLLGVRAGHLDPRQGIDDRLGMDLFLDVDGHDGHGQLGAVLLVLALPDELRIERRIARGSCMARGACSSSATKSRSSSVGMFLRLSLWRMDSTGVGAGLFLAAGRSVRVWEECSDDSRARADLPATKARPVLDRCGSLDHQNPDRP